MEQSQANFCATLQCLVENEKIQQSIKNLFVRDSEAMVIPFCPALTIGSRISHNLGIPLPHISIKDLNSYYTKETPAGISEMASHEEIAESRMKTLEPDQTRAGTRFGSLAASEAEKSLVSFLLNIRENKAPHSTTVPSLCEDEDEDEDEKNEEEEQDVRCAHLENAEPCRSDKECIAIAVYNYKGGVGKTSTAICLAASLAFSGKRVCIVDGDGQCNTTSFFHPDLSEQSNEMSKKEFKVSHTIPSDKMPPTMKPCQVDVFRSRSWRPSTDNLYEALKPCLKVGPDLKGHKYVKCPTLLSVSCEQLPAGIECGKKRKITEVKEKDSSLYKGNLLLLPGRSKVSEFEFASKNGDKAECRNYGVVGKLFDMMAKDYGLQYIIVDLGPSIDDLNMVLALSCDYILPPAHPEYFSTCSVKGLLCDILPEWYDWRNKHRVKLENLPVADRTELQEAGFFEFESFPKILPFLVQSYKIEPELVPKQIHFEEANSIWSIKLLVEDERIKQEIRDLFFPDGKGQMVVPFCCMLDLVPAISHTTGIPLIHLSEEVIHRQSRQTRSAMSSALELKEVLYAKKCYDTLANFVCGLPSVRKAGTYMGLHGGSSANTQIGQDVFKKDWAGKHPLVINAFQGKCSNAFDQTLPVIISQNSFSLQHSQIGDITIHPDAMKNLADLRQTVDDSVISAAMLVIATRTGLKNTGNNQDLFFGPLFLEMITHAYKSPNKITEFQVQLDHLKSNSTINFQDKQRFFVPAGGHGHWAIAVAYIAGTKIEYRDSLGRYLLKKNMDALQSFLAFAFPGAWTVDLIRDTPLQEDNVQCSLFAVAFADCISDDKSLQICTHDAMLAFRKELYLFFTQCQKQDQLVCQAQAAGASAAGATQVAGVVYAAEAAESAGAASV